MAVGVHPQLQQCPESMPPALRKKGRGEGRCAAPVLAPEGQMACRRLEALRAWITDQGSLDGASSIYLTTGAPG